MEAENLQQIIEAGWDTPPRWLRHTGLPQVLGQTPMDVLDLLLRRVLSYRDRKRPGARPDGQHYPPDSVPFTRGDLARQIGVSEKTVKRAVAVLVAHNLVQILSRGYPGVPSWASVDTKLLERIYVLSCSEIPKEHGGVVRKAREGEHLLVRIYRGEEPIGIRRALASCNGWSEPPLALIEALCKTPDRFSALLDMRGAAVDLEVACLDLVAQRERGELEELDAVDGVRARFEELRWAPPELRAIVENLLSGGT